MSVQKIEMSDRDGITVPRSSVRRGTRPVPELQRVEKEHKEDEELLEWLKEEEEKASREQGSIAEKEEAIRRYSNAIRSYSNAI